MRQVLRVAAMLMAGILTPAALGQGAEGDPGIAAAAAQPGSSEIKVDAAGLMRDAEAAMARLKSLAYQSSTRGVGGLAVRRPEVTATVRMVRAGDRDPLGWKFLIRGTASPIDEAGSSAFSAAYDGTAVRSVREKEKLVLESAWSNRAETLGEAAADSLAWAVRWQELVSRPFADPETSPKCRYEGEALVEGQKCQVVYVDYSEVARDALLDAWWYFGKDDALPRRVELHFMDTGAGDGFSSTTLTALEPGAPLEGDALALAAPQGFEVKKVQEPATRGGARADRSPGPRVGEMAPDWTLKDASGKEHKLSDFRGKVVVMDFWATWCGPCRMAMPGVQKIHETYGGKGAVVFGINCWENADPAQFMKEGGYTYGLLLDGDGAAAAYSVSGIPAIYVIGKDGKVLYGSVGFEGDEVVEAAVKQGLAN